MKDNSGKTPLHAIAKWAKDDKYFKLAVSSIKDNIKTLDKELKKDIIKCVLHHRDINQAIVFLEISCDIKGQLVLINDLLAENEEKNFLDDVSVNVFDTRKKVIINDIKAKERKPATIIRAPKKITRSRSVS